MSLLHFHLGYTYIHFVPICIIWFVLIALVGSHDLEAVLSCLPTIFIKICPVCTTKVSLIYAIYHQLYDIDNIHFRELETI